MYIITVFDVYNKRHIGIGDTPELALKDIETEELGDIAWDSATFYEAHETSKYRVDIIPIVVLNY